MAIFIFKRLDNWFSSSTWFSALFVLSNVVKKVPNSGVDIGWRSQSLSENGQRLGAGGLARNQTSSGAKDSSPGGCGPGHMAIRLGLNRSRTLCHNLPRNTFNSCNMLEHVATFFFCEMMNTSQRRICELTGLYLGPFHPVRFGFKVWCQFDFPRKPGLSGSFRRRSVVTFWDSKENFAALFRFYCGCEDG